MKPYPFISLLQALVLLRVSVAIFFMAHAAVRIGNGSIPQFAAFLESTGLVYGTILVWLVSIYELTAGLLMALGIMTRWMTTGFLFIAVIGILLIHQHFGWFVGEHGTGGMEYSFSLIVSLVVIAASDIKTTK